MIDFFKKHKAVIAVGILALIWDMMMGGIFFILLFIYGLFIKLLLSDILTGKLRKVTTATIWILLVVGAGLTFYVNRYMPHGPSYPTGEIVCQNDGRGPCAEQYIEDTRDLDIPEWAKFTRTSANNLLLMGLLFAGIVSGTKKDIE